MYNFDDLCQYAEYSVLIYSQVTMQLPSAIVDFYLFHNGPIEMQI